MKSTEKSPNGTVKFPYDEIREPNKRFLVGDYINDSELLTLYEFYKDLSDKLFTLGDRYHLAWKEAHNEFQRLHDMKNARKSHKYFKEKFGHIS